MDYSAFTFTLTLILVPIIIGIIASVIFYIYDALTTNHKGFLKNLVSRSFLDKFNKKKNIFLQDGPSNSMNYILLLYLAVSLFLTYLLTDVLLFNSLNLSFNLIIILFCLLIPLILSGINYTSQQLYKTSKEFFKTLLDYYLPLVVSILSIFIMLFSYGINLSELSLGDISNFQITSQIRFFDGIMPAFFIIINPFAAIAFFTSMMGIFRSYRKDFYRENSINLKLFSKTLRNVCFLGIILLFIFLFIGGGFYFDENVVGNITMCIIISVLITVFISLIDYGRPKLFIERKTWNYINIPLIFSILAILYSFLLLYVEFSFMNLI